MFVLKIFTYRLPGYAFSFWLVSPAFAEATADTAVSRGSIFEFYSYPRRSFNNSLTAITGFWLPLRHENQSCKVDDISSYCVGGCRPYTGRSAMFHLYANRGTNGRKTCERFECRYHVPGLYTSASYWLYRLPLVEA